MGESVVYIRGQWRKMNDLCVCSGVVEKGETQKGMGKLEQFLNSFIFSVLKSRFGNITFVPFSLEADLSACFVLSVGK